MKREECSHARRRGRGGQWGYLRGQSASVSHSTGEAPFKVALGAKLSDRVATQQSEKNDKFYIHVDDAIKEDRLSNPACTLVLEMEELFYVASLTDPPLMTD